MPSLPSSRPAHVRPTSRHSRGERLVTALIGALVLVMLALVVHAVRTERARDATAASALRDYAAIAAWRYARLLEQDLHDISQEVSRPLAGLREGGERPLPEPQLLLPVDQWSSRSGLASATHFAFRLDIGTGELRAAGGDVTPEFDLWIRARLPAAAARGGWDTHRSLLDTLGGRTVGAVYRIVRREGDFAPRVLYGLMVEGDALLTAVPAMHRQAELLPPALAGAPPQAEVIGLRVALPGGTLLYERGPQFHAERAGRDTLTVDQGGLIITATLAPALLASGPLAPGPSALAPLAILMLGGIMLGVLAVLQLRRSMELSRLREQFVANVSHELRTPLAQISLFGETLMEGRERSGEERRYFAGVIFRETQRLAALVDNILRFSRDATAADSIACEELELEPELRDAADAFGPIADAAGVTITLSAEPALRVHADRSALRQILLNLLDNAVKYGAASAVQLSARSANGDVLVSIADGGPGIPAADRERVFEPFVRLARTGAAAVPGTGIGLSVVRTLARAMNGDVTVDDVNGSRGACITLRLPASARG